MFILLFYFLIFRQTMNFSLLQGRIKVYIKSFIQYEHSYGSIRASATISSVTFSSASSKRLTTVDVMQLMKCAGVVENSGYCVYSLGLKCL